jgi:predicted TIM-barrel fold metal-dependent hydrolase
VVIDHFGRVPASAGVASPVFQSLLKFLKRENVWAKLMGPYFISDKFPQYPDVTALAQAMVEMAPDRLVWGTDWPHPGARQKMPNDGDLADLLAEWVPDEAQRRRILVDNPSRLYDFK